MNDLGVPHKPLVCGDAAKLSPHAKSSSSFTVTKPLNSMVNNNTSSLNSTRARIRSDAIASSGVGVHHSASTAMLQKFA